MPSCLKFGHPAALQIVETPGIVTCRLQDQLQGLAPDPGHHLPDFPEISGGVGTDARINGELGGIGLEEQTVQRNTLHRPPLLISEILHHAGKSEVGMWEGAPPGCDLLWAGGEAVQVYPLIPATPSHEPG